MVKMRIFWLITVFLMIFATSCRKSNYGLPTDESITDNGAGTGTVTWRSDHDYILEGLVFVNDGQTLTIEPGTVIRGKTGQADRASALIVARGGRIIANGTAQKPIIFTVEGDDLEGSIPLTSYGLWGGLIILGNAPLNVSGNEAFIEGISINEPRGVFGGDNPDDDSGILQYVSIRHGGTNIGEGNEINGLTLGGVGRGTVIDHVEVLANADDGVEIFGGTVNCKHLAVAFCGDDAFDFDMGYQGKGQFWLAIMRPESGNLIIELDGSTGHPSQKPYTKPAIYNLTAVGRGPNENAGLVSFSTNAAGIINNSIFVNQHSGIKLEYDMDHDNSLEQWQAGNLHISGNTFYNVAANTPENVFTIVGDDPGNETTLQWIAYFTSALNQIKNPGFIIQDETYHLFPDEQFTGEVTIPDDPWFENTDHQGAFKNYDWLLGWSLLSKEGIVK